MKLFALSDLHVNHRENQDAVASLPARPDDWLILAGDLGERGEHLEWVFSQLAPRWKQVLWVPGNHELYTTPKSPLRGLAKYTYLTEICREFGVLSPEDPWPQWPDDPSLWICPLFLLYDYSFAPEGMTREAAIRWAAEAGIASADERYLHADPFDSKEAWCADRIEKTQRRLSEIPAGDRTILINHWPLRPDLVRLFRIPRFIPWCGTRKTENWHVRHRAEVVVSGHLHMRATDWRDGVRFEEVALGYPRHWSQEKGAPAYLRQIWPAPLAAPASGEGGPMWHR
jgi:predicted phosphodiesterase